MSDIELNDQTVREEIIPNIDTMTGDQLEYYFPQMVYALNNSESFSESFLTVQLHRMKSRQSELLRKTFISQIEEARNK